MRFAKVEPGVNPREQITYVILHGVFNLLSCFSFGAFFLIGLFSRRLRKNMILLSLFAAFTFTCATNTLLLWTGYIFKDVPFSLCVASGAFGSSTSLLQVAAALALVLKVWAHTMMINHPQSIALQSLSSSIVLCAAPWLVTLPFLIVGLAVGATDYTMVSRGSPLYCAIRLDAFNLVFLVFNGLCEVTSVVLAIWTGYLIARTRWRSRTMRSANGNSGERNGYYALTIRTLIFSLLLLVAFAGAIASGLTSFVNPVTDVVIAIVTALAVPVFGSDPTILKMLFHCQRDNTSSSGAQSSKHAVSISLSQHTHIQRDLSSTRLDQFSAPAGIDCGWKSFAASGADETALPKLAKDGRFELEYDASLSVYDGSRKL